MFVSTAFQLSSSTSFDTDPFLTIHEDLLDFPRCASREVSGFVEDQDTAGLVDSWLASGSETSKPAASSALAALSDDVEALAETSQLEGCSHNEHPIEGPIQDVAIAADDVQPCAPSPAVSASRHTTDTKFRTKRKNIYNSREQNINRELLALLHEGMVELWFGEHGIAGESCISAIRSSKWSAVIDRLNRSINSQSKPGTPSENLTQCLRDCGVVPRKAEGRTKKNWRKPVDGVWEFSVEAWRERQDRLSSQYAGVKRKRAPEEQETEEASKSSRPAASKRSSRRPPSAQAPVASDSVWDTGMSEPRTDADGEWGLGEEAELWPSSAPLSPLPMLDAHVKPEM